MEQLFSVAFEALTVERESLYVDVLSSCSLSLVLVSIHLKGVTFVSHMWNWLHFRKSTQFGVIEICLLDRISQFF